MRTIFSNFAVFIFAIILICPAVYGQESAVEEPAEDEIIITREESEKQVRDLIDSADDLIEEAADLHSLFSKDRDVYFKDSDTIINTPTKFAKINILNKLTAESQTVLLESGVERVHGTLNIKLYDCVYDVSYESSDVKILLEITEKAPEDFVNMSLVGKEVEVGKKIFFGWMLKSSPAISSLEHPVYDITINGCEL